MDQFYADYDVTVNYVPYDAGVSFSRASLINRVTTPYILYGDDDFIFTEQTNLALPLAYLMQHAAIGLVGGNMYDCKTNAAGAVVKTRRRFERILTFHDRQRGVISTPIDYIIPKTDIFDNAPFYHCDMTLNWALCRKEIFDDPGLQWDAQFKISGEHENFFFQLHKLSDWKVVYCPAMICDHKHEEAEGYNLLRSRQTGWQALGKKWDLEWMLDIGSGLRMFSDFESPTPFTAKFGASSQQTPSKQHDFLRLWADGSASASISPVQTLKSARATATTAGLQARKRIEGLKIRNQTLQDQIGRLKK